MSAIDYINHILKIHFSPQELFSITQDPKGKNLLLHYQLVSRKPDEEILAWITECNEKYRDYLSTSDHAERYFLSGKHMVIIISTGLSPLSVAVWMDREAIVDALCSSPHVDLERKDKRGWTALQHAIAHGNPKILERIEQAIGLKAKERFPFLRQVANPAIPEEGRRVVGYRDERRSYGSLTQEQFQKLSGGFSFYNGVVGTPDALFRNWYQEWITQPEILPWMAERYAAYCENPPQLMLTEEEEIEQPGVRAQTAISQGEFVTFYDPELVFKNEKGIFNAQEKHILVVRTLRNFGSHINDGFPNVCAFPLMLDGLQLTGYIALRDIQPEERLLSDYGFMEPLKLGERTELAFEEIQKAFPDMESLKEALQAIPKKNKNPKVQFRYQVCLAGLAYLIHTPSALLSLVLRGHFSVSDIEKFLQKPALQASIPCEEKLKSFYARAFPVIQLFEEGNPSLPTRVFVAEAFQRNPRAALFALGLAQSKWKQGAGVWKKEFTMLYQRAKEFARAKSEPDLAVDVDRVLVEEAPLESKSGLGVVNQA